MRSGYLAAWAVLSALVFQIGSSAAREDYGARIGESLGAPLPGRTQGPIVLVNAVDPALRRWYVNQELFHEYQWQQWEYTNYARSAYQRYVDIRLEGDSFYDIYGNFVTRGFLIYNNAQDRPAQFGNTLFKSTRFDNWFSNVVIAQDKKGQYGYSLTVSSELNTTLTPLTFPQADLRWGAVRHCHGSSRGHGIVLAH